MSLFSFWHCQLRSIKRALVLFSRRSGTVVALLVVSLYSYCYSYDGPLARPSGRDGSDPVTSPDRLGHGWQQASELDVYTTLPFRSIPCYWLGRSSDRLSESVSTRSTLSLPVRDATGRLTGRCSNVLLPAPPEFCASQRQVVER
jgi:hypothetical protein